MLAATDGRSDFLHTIDHRGRDVLAAVTPVGYQDWGLVAKLDLAEAAEPVTRLGARLLPVTVSVLLAAAGASCWLARRFTRPIVQLTRLATHVAAGNLEMDVDLARGANDETGDLSGAFQRMTENLRRQRDDLHQRIELERASRLEVE